MPQTNTKEVEQIIQGNRIIAEFNKDTLIKKGFINEWATDLDNLKETFYNSCEHGNYYLANSKYRTSWDWLISVIDKIESLGYEVQIGKYLYRINDYYYCIIHNQGDSTYFETDKSERISAVWYAAIDFITWFNTIKNKQ